MEYLYAARENYEAYASGRVIYHKSGLSTFPVRLASELFIRCRAFCKKQEALTRYGPFCGEGFLLIVLAIISDKAQKVHSPYFRRLKLLRAGKRKIELLQLKD